VVGVKRLAAIGVCNLDEITVCVEFEGRGVAKGIGLGSFLVQTIICIGLLVAVLVGDGYEISIRVEGIYNGGAVGIGGFYQAVIRIELKIRDLIFPVFCPDTVSFTIIAVFRDIILRVCNFNKLVQSVIFVKCDSAQRVNLPYKIPA